MNKVNEYDLVPLRCSLKSEIYDILHKRAKKIGVSVPILIRIICADYVETGQVSAIKKPTNKSKS